MEPLPPVPEEETPPEPAAEPNKIRRAAGRLALELFVVFLGVYGAFMLKAWREEQQREEIKLQVYGALLEELKDVSRNTEPFNATVGVLISQYDSLYQAGQMPSMVPTASNATPPGTSPG